jgi:hypothetical protein
MPQDIRDVINVTTAETIDNTPVSTTPVTVAAEGEKVEGLALESKALENDVKDETKTTNVEDSDKQEANKGFLKKIDKMTAKMSQKDKELQELRQTIERMQQPKQREVDLDNLTVDERIRHLAHEEAKNLMRQQVEQQVYESEVAKENQVWNDKVNEAITRYPDFDEVLNDARIPMHPVVLDAIRNSDYGADIAYKLASEPELAHKLGKVDPITQSKMLLKMELEFEKILPQAGQTKVEKVSKAPATTPTPGKTGLATTNKPLEMSMDDFIKYRKQRGTLK